MIPIPRLLALTALATGLLHPEAASADKLLFSGEHGIKFTHNGVIKEVVAEGIGVAIVNGSAGGSSTLNTLQLTRPFATLSETAMVGSATPSGVAEIHFEGVRIRPALQGGVFAPILGAVQNTSLALTENTLPAEGMVRICNFTGCGASVALDLGQTSAGMAIGPGVGMTPITATGMSGTPMTITPPTPTMVTVIGSPWTIGTTSVPYRTTMGATKTTTSLGKTNPIVLTGMGFAQGPLGKTGTTLDTIMGTQGSIMGGSLQLVTGVRTTCTGCAPSSTPSGQIVRLTLNFAPEPGLLLLFGSGSLGLALLGRKRIRK